MFSRIFGAALGLCIATVALAEGREASRTYVFGNSLVNYLSETEDNTNVPHWLNDMASFEGKTLALDGQWGFLRNFADSLPPSANWSFRNVQGAWSPDRVPFGQANFDAVVVTPGNFIQYQLPDVPYDGDNPTGESPLGATLRLLDWVSAQSPSSRLFLYEGWAEMTAIAGGFPPSAEGYGAYRAYNLGDHHAWFQDLQSGVNDARPGLQLRMIPVASVLGQLFAPGGLLADMPATALYVDGDPHGTQTLYFLAAMVTYAAIYEAPPPAGYRPPATLHPDVVGNYPEIAQFIWNAAPETPQEAAVRVDVQTAAATVEAVAEPLPERQPVALPPQGLRPEGLPALGMGLNGVSDWSTQHPFIDIMKSSRDWVGHLPDQWGGFTAEQMRAGGYLDANGWPIRMPDGIDRLESVMLTDQPETSDWLAGDYVVIYEGTGPIEITGRAKRVRYSPGEITFTYAPGEGVVGIALSDIPADDPVRNIHVFRQDQRDLFEAGVLFNPVWIDLIKDMRSVRFMDWMLTNGSPIQSWEDRPQLEDASWTVWGVPAEVMIALANQIGADPWFNMPHMADDTYVRNFATLVRDTLDPRLKAYVEYSNEVWNQIFPQALWARQQSEALWGESDTGWMQFYGLRSAQVADIWAQVFGPDTDTRLVRVISTHTGWPGLEEDILKAPLAFLLLGRAPQDSFDAYAVTGYFGYEMGGPEMAQRMNDWLDRAEILAQAAGQDQGLRRVALREFVKDARFDAAIAPVALALEQGSLRELTTEVFPYHANVARRAGLTLIMYEGGTHVSGYGERVNDERLTEFLTQFNYTPEMAKLYEQLLAGWTSAGGRLFNAFVDVAPATQWGSWGALRHLNDVNPRWDMLMAYNASGPNSWEVRDPNAFVEGLFLRGNNSGQQLVGTAEEDILLGGSGADVLVSAGGSDVLSGGAGQDRAILPGTRSDYAFGRMDNRLLAQRGFATVTLTSVEEIEFEGLPGQAVPVSDF